MSDDYGVSVREWTDVVRRARLGRTVKAVAGWIVTYADGNGTRIFPGVARVCVDSEWSYEVVSRTFKVLREAGLIERVAQGSRRHRKADEYRLILAPDVLDRIEVLTPAQVTAEAQRIADENSGRARPKKKTTDLPPAAEGADDDSLPPAGIGADKNLPGPGQGADEPVAEESAPRADRCTDKSAPRPSRNLPPVPGGPTIHGPRHVTTTLHTDEQVRTGLTVVGGSAVEDPNLSLPEKCSHGVKARLRPDGSSSCVFCRRATVVQLVPKGATA